MTGADRTHEADGMLSDDELMRYSRQILLEGWDVGAQLGLKSSKVIILGAGGLGCPVSETLARAGVGRIHIIDDDVIEASNLQRQTLFYAQDVGKLKAEVACRALQQINPYIEVSYATCRIVPDNAMNELVGQAEHTGPVLLLDCTDNFAIRELLNKVSVQSRLPLLSASAIGMTGQLALYEPAKNSGCYHCVFGETLDDSDSHDGSDTSSESDTRNCTNSGVLASTTTVMGNLQANAALQYLGLNHNPLAGELLIWNGSRMTQNKLRYRQDKHCKVCAAI